MKKIMFTVLLVATGNVLAQSAAIRVLGQDFFAWRAVTQPAAGDDIPRVERHQGWQPDFSTETLQAIRKMVDNFRARLQAIKLNDVSRADSVDYLCLRSAIERVHWEIDILRAPFRNPDFYVHQTLGAVFELLLVNAPMTDQRALEIAIRLESFPATIASARQNLDQPLAPFARIAIANLDNVATNLQAVHHAIKLEISDSLQPRLSEAFQAAAVAMNDYITWLENELPQMGSDFAIGHDNYSYFLKQIAMFPHSPQELLAQGRQEWHRAVAFESYEKARNRELPPLKVFESLDAQIRQGDIDEQAIRDFLEAQNLMTIPDWLPHYRSVAIPDYLAPFSFMGVMDDLTSETRLDEEAVRYAPEPQPDLSYFLLSCATDPRPIIVHEGIPGHYYQMALSWKNPREIRRRFIDSGANEGIGFYVEELLLQYGLFDNLPKTREIIYNFMRLRALRVEVDIQLALGNFDVEQAGDYLAKSVPMDRGTAVQEAGFFAYNPGQAISYQIGKTQILKFLADAKIHLGENFDIREFHDFLMLNGNVPIALLRWEYLGFTDEIGNLW